MARRPLAYVAALFVVSLLALLPMATAFAIAPAQDVNPDLVGVYETDVLESDDSDGLIISVSLFDDGSMEALSDYLDDRKILEIGSWYDNGDGTITLVFDGTIDEAYSEPTELQFEVVDDGLVNADLTQFSEDGLVLYATGEEPVALAGEFATETESGDDEGALEEEAEEAADDSDDSTAADDDLFDVPGLYISNEIDADGTPAAVMLYLNEDGSAETVAMNFTVGGIFPIARTGFWEEDADGAVTITLEAELVAAEDGEAVSEELDEPESLTFDNDEGLLENELFTFFPVDEIEALVAGGDDGADDSANDAADDAIEDEVDEAVDDALQESGIDMAGATMYMSTMDQLMSGNIVVLLLLADGTASMSTQLGDGDQLVEGGTWETDDDDNIVVTLTEDEEGNVYDEPSVLVFEQTDELTLTGIDYDTEIYGDDLVIEASPEE